MTRATGPAGVGSVGGESDKGPETGASGRGAAGFYRPRRETLPTIPPRGRQSRVCIASPPSAPHRAVNTRRLSARVSQSSLVTGLFNRGPAARSGAAEPSSAHFSFAASSTGNYFLFRESRSCSARSEITHSREINPSRKWLVTTSRHTSESPEAGNPLNAP